MKKIYLLALVFLSTLNTFAQSTDLYFSKYGEGSSNNKFLEIYNGTGSTVDLSNYSVELYANGAATASNTHTFTAGTMLASGDVYVLRNSGAANATIIAAADASSSTCNYNGDDALALKKMGAVIDVIGAIGTDPGASWAVGATAGGTLDHTLIRKLTVCSPNPVNLSSFGTDDATSEWIVYPIDGQLAELGTYSGCSTAITFAITSPTNGTVFSPETTSVNVNLSVNNFNVANGTGNGHIHYTINGGPVVMKYDTTPIVIPTTPGTYIVYAELVDNSHTPIVPAKNATVTFTVAAYTTANTLAAVRGAGIGAWVNFTGQAFVSYARTPRNQKYIQDATAGILIDDNAILITTPFVIGDGISTLKGQLVNFNGVMELVPNQNATKPSTGNAITAITATTAEISANIDMYESRLVQINGVTFADGNGSNVFAVNTNYNVADANTIVFRTLFAEANYIGQLIPTGSTNIGVLVAENNGTAQVVARSLAELTLSNKNFNAIDGLAMYPNPLSGKVLNITSFANEEMSVNVYDVLGKEVLSSKVINNTVNVSNLNSGLYIIKITENDKTATRKLIIE